MQCCMLLQATFLSANSSLNLPVFPWLKLAKIGQNRQKKQAKIGYKLFKLSAYKTGVSMRIFKLQVLSLFKLPFAISGENRSLNEHLRPNFGLK